MVCQKREDTYDARMYRLHYMTMRTRSRSSIAGIPTTSQQQIYAPLPNVERVKRLFLPGCLKAVMVGVGDVVVGHEL